MNRIPSNSRYAGYCKRGWLVATAILLLTGCGQDDLPDELAYGQEPYLRYCASCHDNDGSGKPPAFPPLDGSEWLDLGPEAVALITLNGLRGEIEVAGQRYRGFMPPMRNIPDEELAALLDYVSQAWADWAEVPDSAAIGRLRDGRESRQPLEGLTGVEQALKEAGS